MALACAVSTVAVTSGTEELAEHAVRARRVPDVRWLVDRCAADPAEVAAIRPTRRMQVSRSRW